MTNEDQRIIEQLTRLKTQVESAIGTVRGGHLFKVPLREGELKLPPGHMTIGDFDIIDRFYIKNHFPLESPEP